VAIPLDFQKIFPAVVQVGLRNNVVVSSLAIIRIT